MTELVSFRLNNLLDFTLPVPTKIDMVSEMMTVCTVTCHVPPAGTDIPFQMVDTRHASAKEVAMKLEDLRERVRRGLSACEVYLQQKKNCGSYRVSGLCRWFHCLLLIFVWSLGSKAGYASVIIDKMPCRADLVFRSSFVIYYRPCQRHLQPKRP